MNLIDDTDLREILKIKDNEGQLLLTSIKYLFGIERLNQIYRENSSLSGLDFIESIINRLNIKYSISEGFKKHIPPSGPFIIIANHHFGIIDGMILIKMVCEIQPDFKMQGNYSEIT